MTPLEAERAINAAIAAIEQLQKQVEYLTKAFELLEKKVEGIATRPSSSTGAAS